MVSVVAARLTGRHTIQRRIASMFPQLDRPPLYGARLEEPRNVPGQFILMTDGGVWFHPFEGGAPVHLNRKQARRLTW